MCRRIDRQIPLSSTAGNDLYPFHSGRRPAPKCSARPKDAVERLTHGRRATPPLLGLAARQWGRTAPRAHPPRGPQGGFPPSRASRGFVRVLRREHGPAVVDEAAQAALEMCVAQLSRRTPFHRRSPRARRIAPATASAAYEPRGSGREQRISEPGCDDFACAITKCRHISCRESRQVWPG